MQWYCQTFWSAAAVERFLNELPPDRALEAKISMTDALIYVWYREE